MLVATLYLQSVHVAAQSPANTGGESIFVPCAVNLTCPLPSMCYLAPTGLTCLAPQTTGCRALALPGTDYYIGPIVPFGNACQRCPLPGDTTQMQLLVDRYQQSVPGQLVLATLTGLGNCGIAAYCSDTQACNSRKKMLSSCTSSEQVSQPPYWTPIDN
jgi:hypothetical protein